MPVIQFTTFIAAPPDIVFDLARSIDLHRISVAHTGEEAVKGTTSGLISMNESVTWRAKHFGIVQHLTSKITAYNRPHYFTDEMVAGAFKSFKHEHIFKEENGGTLMTDVFMYQSPLAILGIMADMLFLKKYMRALLIERNRIVKEFAENPSKYNMIPGL